MTPSGLANRSDLPCCGENLRHVRLVAKGTYDHELSLSEVTLAVVRIPGLRHVGVGLDVSASPTPPPPVVLCTPSSSPGVRSNWNGVWKG